MPLFTTLRHLIRTEKIVAVAPEEDPRTEDAPGPELAMVARAEFEQSYERLLDASNRHVKNQLDNADYDTLTASRAELDLARSANTAHRRQIVRRRDYATPDAVPPGLGLGGLDQRGRWATAGGALAFLAATALVVAIAIQTTRPGPLEVSGEIVEQITDNCGWTVSVPFTNTGDEALAIISVGVLIDARPVVVWWSAPGGEVLAPGASTQITFERRMSPCPETPEDVEHGELRATWLPVDSSVLGHVPPPDSETMVRWVDDELMRHRF